MSFNSFADIVLLGDFSFFFALCVLFSLNEPEDLFAFIRVDPGLDLFSE